MGKVLFYAYLMWVSWQDFKEMEVIRYSHLLGGFAIVLQILALRISGSEVEKGWIIAVIHLSVLQIVAYRFQWYGMADVIVLFLCGMWLFFVKGKDNYLQAYFVLQAMAGSFLWGIQCLKENVKGLCLLHPVAYIPYISIAFVLTNIVL